MSNGRPHSEVAQPSGTVTLVFTDIEGSTRLLEQLGTDGYREALAEHRRVVRDACAWYDGYEVDTEGDAFFYAFASAPAAVNAISEAMRGLDGGPIRIRVGIHTGQPELDGPNYIGLDVHRAARIMSSAHGGQVVLTQHTAQLLDNTVELKDLGNHHFKDFDAPERIYQLGTAEHPPLRSLYRLTLPVPATPFLGREHEVAQVVALLTNPDTRLLTLTGPGGTGKTRLAIEAASKASGAFPDGTTWIPLAPLRDPALVIPTIAGALELPEETGSAVDIVIRALAGKRALLVVDNLEHLLPEAAVALAQLAAGCPTLTILVTSRERLAIEGERENPVGALGHRDAVDLLAARAAALSVPVERDEAVDALVDRLDRLPLAVELAAARLKLFRPEQLLARLGERLDMLKGPRDADPRQETLRATIAWSYDLLTPAEQRLFRRLSVFRGAARVAAAESVCGANVDDLQSLLDKSLVRRRDDGGEPGLWMLETIRVYAEDALGATPEDEIATRDAHVEWFYALAQPEHDYPWTASPEHVSALEAALDDLRAVHETLVERSDVLRALRLAVALFPLWEVRDRFVEGDRWFARALELPGAELSAERGVALDARSSTADHLIRPEDCRRYAEEAVRILRRSGTDGQLAMAMQGLASAIHATDPAAAIALGEEALRVARGAADWRTVRTIALNMGAYATDTGDHDRAEAHYEEALELSRELEDDHFVGACLEGLGDVHLDRGRYEEARALYLEAAERALPFHQRLTLGTCVGGLAAATAALGEHELAARLWASFERWEAERGDRMQPVRRSRYEKALAGLRPDARREPALPLDDAFELARTRAARQSPA
jgi:predicted ATPase/class 3 adenylate cyclase